MPDLGPWEILIIAAVVMVLFGSKKLPGAAKSLGQSMRIFKTEVKGLRDDDSSDTPSNHPQQAIDSAAVHPAPVRQPMQMPPPAVEPLEPGHDPGR